MTARSRRAFLVSSLTLAAAPVVRPGAQSPRSDAGGATDSFPGQPPALVHEMVTVSHFNVKRVSELLAERPALARAAWDWGYGDWETALGAASHVGSREIAELLLASGAHPTIFSAAMLGQLETVKAFIAARPGVQRTRGPHGITLLSHARAGGAPAQAVVSYLESLGDADPRYPNDALDTEAATQLVGTYVFGSLPTERLIVSVSPRGGLAIKRDGAVERGLFHHGQRVFNPQGAEAVRIRFEPATGLAAAVVVEDGSSVVKARRIPL